MKRKFVVVSALLLSLAIGVYAAEKNSENITFHDPVKIANTTVPAGDYKVVWDGSGSNVQVSFLQGKKTVATAPATLVDTGNNVGKSVSLKKDSDNSQVLSEITFKKRALRFDESAPAAGN